MLEDYYLRSTKMAIVEELTFGECKIYVDDSYCSKVTPEEIKQKLKEISQIYSEYFTKYPEHYIP